MTRSPYSCTLCDSIANALPKCCVIMTPLPVSASRATSHPMHYMSPSCKHMGGKAASV